VIQLREHHVVLNGIRLHYLEWGLGGDAVVLLHGGGLNAYTWDKVAGALGDNFHCYAPDLRGHGDSEWSPTMEYGIGPHAADLARFVDHLGLTRCFLVGHSLGGLTAVRYAARHSRRIAGLVVVDVSPFVNQNAEVNRIRRFVLGRTEFPSLDDAVAYTRHYRPQRKTAGLRRSLARSLRLRPDGRWTWKHDLRHIDDHYFSTVIEDAHALLDEVDEIRCPVLVIRGSEGCPVDDASRFAALLHDGRLVTIGDAGHNVHRDKPHEFVNALRSFLEQPSPTAT
jgi:pimeloyl-ACP methyl ester carboxylesterase